MSCYPLSPKDIANIRQWLSDNGLPVDLLIDHAISVDMSVLTVPSPMGVEVPYYVINESEGAETPVRIVNIEGIAAAIRANHQGFGEIAQRDLVAAIQQISLTEHTCTDDGKDGTYVGWDKYAIGLTGFRNAIAKDRDAAIELLQQHPFGKALIRLIDENPLIATTPSYPTYAYGCELSFKDDGAYYDGSTFNTVDELVDFLFDPSAMSRNRIEAVKDYLDRENERSHRQKKKRVWKTVGGAVLAVLVGMTAMAIKVDCDTQHKQSIDRAASLTAEELTALHSAGVEIFGSQCPRDFSIKGGNQEILTGYLIGRGMNIETAEGLVNKYKSWCYLNK